MLPERASLYGCTHVRCAVVFEPEIHKFGVILFFFAQR